MVRVVNVRSMLYMNNVGKVITEDLGYKLRVGNNTTDFNEDDAMYAFTRTSGQNSSGCLAFKEASRLKFLKIVTLPLIIFPRSRGRMSLVALGQFVSMRNFSQQIR